MLGIILAMALSLIAMFIPGMLFALALLKKTDLHIVEITVIGFILGLILSPTLTWFESYFMNYLHFFSFSLGLFLANILILTIVGLLLCYWQGVFKNFKQEFLSKETHKNTKNWVWWAIMGIMLLTFATRMLSIGTAPTFFEFDPYFDMIDAQYILTFGQQLLLDPSAWPSVLAGTNHRIEPIVPYLSAFWYDMANSISYHYTSFSTALMSYTSGTYPAIVAALLVFCIFMLLYREYNAYIGLIAAALVSTMPVLISTFIAGEQLVEPWGIFALFFFLAAYMLAIKNPKSIRLTILAGVAFVSNFLGAHYYTVTVGVFIAYLLLQGFVNIMRGDMNKDFYKMNAIIIIIVAIVFAIYMPYGSTLQNRIPAILGIPIVISGPIAALILIAIMDYVPKMLHKKKVLFKELNIKTRTTWLILVSVVALCLVLFTPLGTPIQSYLNLSAKFTTPSSPLFMTVQEYIPTGLLYDFGANGFGFIGASVAGIPVLVWVISALGLGLIAISIIYRNSKTGILYAAMALPLMVAGFSEVKYMPHFGVVYLLLFAIILGELAFYAENGFKLKFSGKNEEKAEQQGEIVDPTTSKYEKHKYNILLISSIGLFFLLTPLALAALAYFALTWKDKQQNKKLWAAFVVYLVIIGGSSWAQGSLQLGESSSYIEAISSGLTVSGASSTAVGCNTLANAGADLGYTLYCNTIPVYWLNAMSWLRQNVGPYNARVLAWWDYGDWINWFGNSAAVLRGDNAVPQEDYATAARYVLSQFSPSDLASYMNGNQSRYVLFDQDLISKWQALDFLACVDVNQTSRAFAIAQGQSQNPPQPYVLGNSQCEIQNDQQYALLPYCALVQSASCQQNINYYCTISNSSQQYVQAYLVSGGALANQTVCVNIVPNSNGVLSIYNQSGKKINAVLQASQYLGVTSVQGVAFVQYLMIYLPNGPNGTITDAPTGFYQSNYYKGFFLGKLPGFTQVYPNPNNSSGINMVNGTYPVRIFELNNFTGQLPPVPVKPSWIINNYTMP